MQSIDILHKNFQENHTNSRRFPGGFLNSRRFPGFPGVVDTMSKYMMKNINTINYLNRLYSIDINFHLIPSPMMFALAYQQ